MHEKRSSGPYQFRDQGGGGLPMDAWSPDLFFFTFFIHYYETMHSGWKLPKNMSFHIFTFKTEIFTLRLFFLDRIIYFRAFCHDFWLSKKKCDHIWSNFVHCVVCFKSFNFCFFNILWNKSFSAILNTVYYVARMTRS